MFFQNNSYGELVKKVELKQLGRVDKDAVLLYSGAEIGYDVSENDLINFVKNLYSTEYFSKVDVDMIDGVLTFDLIENPSVNKVFFDGSGLIKYENIKNDLQTKERGIYTRAKLKEDAGLLQSVYQKSGYTSAVVEPKVVILKENRVDVVFEITEGEPAFVKKINFHGLQNFSKKEIMEAGKVFDRGWWSFSKGSRYQQDSIESMKDYILKFYFENGYIDAEIEDVVVQFAKDASDVLIDVYLTEGLRFKINNVKIDAREKNNLFTNLTLKTQKGDFYSLSATESDKMNIENILYKEGMGNMIADIEKVNKNNELGLVDVVFKSVETKAKIIRRVLITGQKKTQDFVIRRELLFSEGSSVIRQDLNRSKNRLMSLGYFKSIDIKEANESGNEVDVIVSLEEDSRRGMFNASAGYSSFQKEIFGLSLSLPNISGSGKDFLTDFSISRINKSFGIGLHTSRFGNSKFGGGIDLSFSDYDPTSYGINYKSKSYAISPTLSYRLGDNLFYYLTYSFREENMKIGTTGSTYLKTLFFNQFKSVITSSITNAVYYDTRDNFILPNMGMRVGGGQTIAGIGGDQRFLKHDFEFSAYKQFLFKDAVSMVSFKGGMIKSLGTDVLFSNRYNVWFYNMRGFGFGGLGPRFTETTPTGSTYTDYISYRGNNYAILSFQQNFALPFAKESGARWYIFSDFAALKGFDGASYIVNSAGNTERIIDNGSIRNATGFGMAIPSPFGVLAIDYSVKVKHEHHDDVQKFRISIGGMPIA